MSNKIVLVGYMGVGKSTIGKKLAKKMNLNFLDLDEIIEKKENSTIGDLFRLKGELYFRKLEHELFQTLIESDDDFVLSTGGGTPCYYNNHLLLEKEQLNSVYLEAPVDTIYQRLINEQKQRPVIKDLTIDELKEFIAKHIFERSYFYQKAKFKIKVRDKNIDEIVNEIKECLL